MLGFIGKMIMFLGGKNLLKLVYKLMIRPELVKLSDKIDPEEKTELDENAILVIDKVIEGL